MKLGAFEGSPEEFKALPDEVRTVLLSAKDPNQVLYEGLIEVRKQEATSRALASIMRSI